MPLTLDDNIDNVQNNPGTVLAVTASSTSSVYVTSTGLPVTATLTNPVTVAISGAINAVFSGTQTITGTVHVDNSTVAVTQGGAWSSLVSGTVGMTQAGALAAQVSGTVGATQAGPLAALVSGTVGVTQAGGIAVLVSGSSGSPVYIGQTGSIAVTASIANPVTVAIPNSVQVVGPLPTGSTSFVVNPVVMAGYGTGSEPQVPTVVTEGAYIPITPSSIPLFGRVGNGGTFQSIPLVSAGGSVNTTGLLIAGQDAGNLGRIIRTDGNGAVLVSTTGSLPVTSSLASPVWVTGTVTAAGVQPVTQGGAWSSLVSGTVSITQAGSLSTLVSGTVAVTQGGPIASLVSGTVGITQAGALAAQVSGTVAVTQGGPLSSLVSGTITATSSLAAPVWVTGTITTAGGGGGAVTQGGPWSAAVSGSVATGSLLNTFPVAVGGADASSIFHTIPVNTVAAAVPSTVVVVGGKDGSGVARAIPTAYGSTVNTEYIPIGGMLPDLASNKYLTVAPGNYAASTTLINGISINGFDGANLRTLKSDTAGNLSTIGTRSTNSAQVASTSVAVLPAAANAAIQTFTEGYNHFASSDLNGQIRVAPMVTDRGGASISQVISAASTNATVIKASLGQVYGWYIFNTNAATRYVKFHNQATTPTAGTGVVFTVAVPAGGGTNVWWASGIPFSTGIAMTTTTGPALTDTVAVAANDLIINILYK